MEMEDYGKVYLRLSELIAAKGISKTQLSYQTHLSMTQLSRFCKNEVSRIDFATIARLCCALGCSVSDLIIYEPPEDA